MTKRNPNRFAVLLNMLYELKSQTRDPTGWVRQHPELARRLRSIPGIVTAKDVKSVQAHGQREIEGEFSRKQNLRLRPRQDFLIFALWK